MTNTEVKNFIERTLSYLRLQYDELPLDAKSISIRNLQQVKDALRLFSDLGYLSELFARIYNTKLYGLTGDEIIVDSDIFWEFNSYLHQIVNGFIGIKSFIEESEHYDSEDIVKIKLPPIMDFDQLARVSQDLKKAIDLPLADSAVDGEVRVISAESGSVWLVVSLKVISAVSFIGFLFHTASKIREYLAKAKAHEEHARTLKLKNDMLQVLIDAHKEDVKNKVETEAKEIADRFYKDRDPEKIERLKLSLTTFSDLIDKGVMLLPMTKDKNVLKKFPDFNTLNLIDQATKSIEE